MYNYDNLGYEWYVEKKHKNKLFNYIEQCYISGCEMDKETNRMNNGNLMHAIYFGENDKILHITHEDYYNVYQEVLCFIKNKLNI